MNCLQVFARCCSTFAGGKSEPPGEAALSLSPISRRVSWSLLLKSPWRETPPVSLTVRDRRAGRTRCLRWLCAPLQSWDGAPPSPSASPCLAFVPLRVAGSDFHRCATTLRASSGDSWLPGSLEIITACIAQVCSAISGEGKVCFTKGDLRWQELAVCGAAV